MATTEENVNEINTPENIEVVPENTKNGKLSSVLKIVIPLVVIAVCMVVAMMMLNSSLKNNSYIDGRFILSGTDVSTYIDIDSNGEYKLVSGGSVQKGEWSLRDGVMKFTSSDGSEINGEFINKKYIILKDDKFLSGEIPDGEFIEAELISAEGISYGFKPDGKFYKKEDGRYVEAGSYITDGYFIIITTEETGVTYLKCKGGITPAFYQVS